MTDDMLPGEKIMEYTDDIVKAAEALAQATVHETELEDNRITVKMAAIERIMSAGDNPMTGKPYSFSAAEAVVNSDSEYQQYLAEQRQAVRGRIIARGVYDAAVAKARLMVGSV